MQNTVRTLYCLLHASKSDGTKRDMNGWTCSIPFSVRDKGHRFSAFSRHLKVPLMLRVAPAGSATYRRCCNFLFQALTVPVQLQALKAAQNGTLKAKCVMNA